MTNLLRGRPASLALYALLVATILISNDLWFAWFNINYLFTPKASDIVGLFILSLLLALLPSFIRRFSLFLAISIMLFQYLHFQYFGRSIWPNEFIMLFQHYDEVFETAVDNTALFIAPVAAYLFSIFLFIWIEIRMPPLMTNGTAGLLLLLVILSVQPVVMNHYLNGSQLQKVPKKLVGYLYSRSGKHSLLNFHTSLSNFLVVLLPKKAQINELQINLGASNRPIIKNKLSTEADVVLIIGESIRDDRLSLFGYPVKTTPYLDSLSQSDNFSFREIYAAGIMTKTSVPALLNRATGINLQRHVSSQNNCLFKMAKENGYTTVFFSGQSERNLRYIKGMICPNYIDLYKNSSLLSTELKSGNELFYDDDLPGLIKKLDFKQKQFIVLQFRTAHSPYRKVYRPDSKLTTDSNQPSISKAYDNAISFMDSVIEQLIQQLKKQSQRPLYLFFTSDHGELLGENGKRGHGLFTEEVYTVPFFLYESSIPQNASLLSKSKEIYNHADLSELLTAALGYQPSFENSEGREFYINGTDIQGFGGYLKATIKNNRVIIEPVQKH